MMLKSLVKIGIQGPVAIGGVGRGPLGCLDCKSSQVSLLFGATPAEVRTWQAFPKRPSLVRAISFCPCHFDVNDGPTGGLAYSTLPKKTILTFQPLITEVLMEMGL